MKLNCHCGAVEAEINATVNELAKIVRCNCSICKRKKLKQHQTAEGQPSPLACRLQQPVQ